MRTFALSLVFLAVSPSCARREPDFSCEISKDAGGFTINFTCTGDETRCLEKISEKVMTECRPSACTATLTKSSVEQQGGGTVLHKLWRCETK
jgi:hypothetical protein